MTVTPDRIRAELRKLNREWSLEHKRHANALNGIAGRRAAIQESCPHAKTTFRGDASLGDSYNECECCGAQL